MQNQIRNPDKLSGLSPAAKKVYPELLTAGITMRKPREEAGGSSVVTIGNRITDKKQNTTDIIDFDLSITSAKSELVRDAEISPEKRNIRRRFMDKVRKNVIGDNFA